MNDVGAVTRRFKEEIFIPDYSGKDQLQLDS
jgi:hypothetical protein